MLIQKAGGRAIDLLLYNYSLSIDQDLNHPRGDNIQYFFSYGADRLDTFKQFDVQSNVFSVRRNFNLDENFFSFFNLEDPVFAPNINLLRVVLNRAGNFEKWTHISRL